MVCSFTSVWGLNYESYEKISLAVLAVVVLLIATVGFLVGTTTGLHLVFNAANRWVPGLDIGRVTGGWRDLTITSLRYQQPGVDVNAGEIHLSVKLACLRDSSLCVNDFSLKDINVVVDTKKCRQRRKWKKKRAGRLISPRRTRLR